MQVVSPEVLAIPAIALLGVAAVTDFASRRIPNRLTVALLAVATVRIGLDLAMGDPALPLAIDLAAAVLVFAAGAVLFGLGLLGGGDVKLVAATSLWLGAGQLGTFLLATALSGGVLAFGFLAAQLLSARPAKTPVSLPYGIAIAAGGIVATVLA